MYGQSYNYSKHASYGSVKKIKNYSYNPLDSIGKGFSSVVYRGQNDDNSTYSYTHGHTNMLLFLILALF